MADDSARTKMIKSMPENLIQKGASWISEKLDKIGFTEKEKYEGKTPEELAKKSSPEPVKKAKGGAIKSASARADGCAQRGKTRGRMI